jgi:hypothetical protein
MTKKERRKLSKSDEYKNLVHTLPCAISGMSPVSAHHPRTGMGMSMKAPDWYCIPLHYDYHQGRNGIHIIGTKVWQQKYGSEMEHARRTQEQLKDLIKIPDEFRLF